MEYPQSFKDKLKKVYNSDKMNQLAEEGNMMLGRYLDDSCTNTISVETILSAKSLDDIKKVARIEKEKFDLYKDWNKLYGEFTNSQFTGK